MTAARVNANKPRMTNRCRFAIANGEGLSVNATFVDAGCRGSFDE
jgi:hypothetical protein